METDFKPNDFVREVLDTGFVCLTLEVSKEEWADVKQTNAQNLVPLSEQAPEPSRISFVDVDGQLVEKEVENVGLLLKSLRPDDVADGAGLPSGTRDNRKFAPDTCA